MKKKITTCALFALITFSAFSQVGDVTFTLSPYAEHTWWNKNTTLDNSTFWGARAGFGFGPLFEVRGFYQKSFDVKANLKSLDWGLTNDLANSMTQSYIDIERYGGEMKLNLMNNRVFAPYITLGAGIQNLSYQIPIMELPYGMKDIKEEQIFGAIGLGAKFNLTDRIVLSLEAKNTFFNVNDKSYYLKPDYNISGDGDKRLGNWSAMASLDFYLGGSKENKNDVHRAYEKMFSDGFAGMKFVLEPSLAYINLKDEAFFEEQYFLGASAGIDFSSLVGIRGFYYQATEDPNKVSLDFNNHLSMYGANIIARLNQPRGINPYLILGGGYIKTGSKYINPLGEMGDQSRGFAMGGVGVEIPLSKYIALFGNINAMLTNKGSKDISTVESPKNVKTSLMYQTGVRFNIGKSVNADYYYDRSLERAISNEREYNNQQVNDLRKEYQRKIDYLNNEIDNAIKEKDYAKAAEIDEAKKALVLESQQKEINKNEYIQLKPEELSIIVREAVRETRQEYPTIQSQPVVPIQQPQQVAPIAQSQPVDSATEPAVSYIVPANVTPIQQQKVPNQEVISQQQVAPQQQAPIILESNNKANKELEKQIKELNKALAAQSSVINDLKSDTVNRQVATTSTTDVAQQTYNNVQQPRVVISAKDPFLRFKGISALGAMEFGSRFYWNLGARGHWQMGNSSFELMPEMHVAFGKKNGFSASANVIYNIGNDYNYSKVKPYVGLGLGVFPSKKTIWGTNIIVGVNYNLIWGSVFADYSIRSIFKQNQIAVGYKFSF